MLRRQLGRRPRGRHAADAQPGPDAGAQQLDELGGGVAGPEADGGPVGDELQGAFVDRHGTLPLRETTGRRPGGPGIEGEGWFIEGRRGGQREGREEWG